jgi:hypothetical protein
VVIAVVLAGAVAVVATTGDEGAVHVSARVAGARDQGAPEPGVPTATVSPADDSLFSGPEPGPSEQYSRLEGWYGNSPADAPGGRPVLDAEVTFCDYRGVLPQVQRVDFLFASYSSLESRLTETDLLEGCRLGTPEVIDPDAKTISFPVSEHAAEVAASPYTICAARLRGPLWDPKLTLHPKTTVLKPVVLFGRDGCTSSGYQTPPAGFLDQLNARRDLEIKVRAVPRDCPSFADFAAWVRKVSTEAGEPMIPWQADMVPGDVKTCWRQLYVDWDMKTVAIG